MSRGGSRYGAGRPGSHAKTSGKRRIDIRQLHRSGHLDEVRRMNWQWSDKSSMGIAVSKESVTFIYQYKNRDGAKVDVNQVVYLDWTRCHYGKARPWFGCPRCGRRVAILYFCILPACRACARLVYPSQSEDALGRGWRRTRKLEGLLAGGEDRPHGKPAGMRWATFERIRQEISISEERRNEDFLRYAARMFPSLGRSAGNVP